MNTKHLGALLGAATVALAATSAQATQVVAIAWADGEHGTATLVQNSSTTDSSISAASSFGGSSAWSYADLETGTLRGGASSLGVPLKPSFNAALYDNFQFNIAGAGVDDITTLFLTIHYDAEILSGGVVALGTSIGVFNNQANGNITLANGINPTFVFTGNDVIRPGFSDDLAFTRPAFGTIHGTTDQLLAFNVRGATSAVTFAATIYATGDGNGAINFGNSAHYHFLLPENVTFTSGSGVSLTAISGAPEPASWALMILGFGGIGATLRRRRMVEA